MKSNITEPCKKECKVVRYLSGTVKPDAYRCGSVI